MQLQPHYRTIKIAFNFEVVDNRDSLAHSRHLVVAQHSRHGSQSSLFRKQENPLSYHVTNLRIRSYTWLDPLLLPFRSLNSTIIYLFRFVRHENLMMWVILSFWYAKNVPSMCLSFPSNGNVAPNGFEGHEGNKCNPTSNCFLL